MVVATINHLHTFPLMSHLIASSVSHFLILSLFMSHTKTFAAFEVTALSRATEETLLINIEWNGTEFGSNIGNAGHAQLNLVTFEAGGVQLLDQGLVHRRRFVGEGEHDASATGTGEFGTATMLLDNVDHLINLLVANVQTAEQVLIDLKQCRQLAEIFHLQLIPQCLRDMGDGIEHMLDNRAVRVEPSTTTLDHGLGASRNFGVHKDDAKVVGEFG